MSGTYGQHTVRDHQFDLVLGSGGPITQLDLSRAAEAAYSERRLLRRRRVTGLRRKVMTRWTSWQRLPERSASSDALPSSSASAR